MEESNNPQVEAQPELAINEQKLQNYLHQLKLEENLPMAIIAGIVSALIGALIWAVVTVATGYQIGYMAVGVGLLVGFAVRFGGKGMSLTFGIIGAIFALLSCFLGNALSIVGFVASEYGVGYFEIIGSVGLGTLLQVTIESFEIMDLLFYGIATYEGYHFAFRNVSEEEIIANAT